MDFNDYLSSLDKNLEKDLEYFDRIEKDFLENILNSSDLCTEICDNTQDSPSIPHDRKNDSDTIARLKLDRRLEESSKSKIGTFETIYNETFLAETHKPIASYGFSDLDYSALVTLLASILEIELNLSIYQAIREKNGIDLSRFYDKNTSGPSITIGKTSIDFGSRKQMLRALQMLIDKEQAFLSSHFKNISRFNNMLKKVIDIRNDASHGLSITKNNFLAFYKTYSELYNGYIFDILDLKENLAPKSQKRKKSKNDASYAYFCSYDNIEEQKDDDDYIRSILESNFTLIDHECNSGIIMTDCRKLSLKYSGDADLYEYIYNQFIKIIKKYKNIGITYRLFDVDDKYSHLLEDNPGWMGYYKALNEYCSKNNISSKEPKGLFIIGGDDVIPMPRIENPSWENHSERLLEETVDADMLYAFNEEAVRVNKNARLSYNALLENIDSPRFYVGRLPLENGMMTTSFDEDIISYLERALRSHSEGGINITSPLFTTCHRAQTCGLNMTEGIPLLELPHNHNIFEANMVISPLTMLSFEADRLQNNSVITDMVRNPAILKHCSEEYLEILSKSDMLIFLLHGGYTPGKPLYYGDAIKRELTSRSSERCSPAAFSPTLFKKPGVHIKSVAGVCCYGARFIDYAREDSALLTAMYNDTMLFYGSSRIALGSFDEFLESSQGQNEYSLVQTRHYLQNLLSGVQAGTAIHNAKTSYVKHYSEARKKNQNYETNHWYFLTTILEFNLFGDPLLNVKKIMDIPFEDKYDFDDIFDFSHDFDCEKSYSVVYSAENEKRKSILDRIRGMVDRNFEDIHNKINEKLYSQYKIEPRDLYCAKKYTDGRGRNGYTLTYKSGETAFESYKIVNTDMDGNINSITETI